MTWKFVEGITVADVAFEARGKNANELFESAAEAVTATMVKEIGSVKHKIIKKINLQSSSIEQLLHDFLEELVFLKDAERLLFSKYEVKVDEGKSELAAAVYGDELDMRKHELLVDVKAVTWHAFEVKKTSAGWRAQVVLDV